MSESIQYDNEWGQKILNIYQTPDVVSQRQAVLSLLKLEQGERVLDIGSGPGLMSRNIAHIVGNTGFVNSIDISEAMVILGQKTCSGISNVEFKQADATQMPFPDDEFNAAVSMQVYEYIDDIPTALLELYRVLQPGGRALILDTDWDTLVWNTENHDRMHRILKTFEGHCCHPHLPRTLALQLRNAGFLVEAQSVYVLLNTKYDKNTYTYGLIDFIASYVSNSGDISSEETENWASELRQLGEKGNYFCSNNRYLFLAVKPPR
jgi:arsenite methyltransferase